MISREISLLILIFNFSFYKCVSCKSVNSLKDNPSMHIFFRQSRVTSLPSIRPCRICMEFRTWLSSLRFQCHPQYQKSYVLYDGFPSVSNGEEFSQKRMVLCFFLLIFIIFWFFKIQRVAEYKSNLAFSFFYNICKPL